MSSLFRFKDHHKENLLHINRVITATIIVFILLIILVTRLIYLQVHMHDKYANLARNNRIRIVSVPPIRGLIHDRHGNLLVENVPTYNLEVIPSVLKNSTETLEKLKQLLDLPDSDIKNFKRMLKYKSRYENVTIAAKLSELQVAKFSLNKYLFPGIEVTAQLSRNYKYGEALAHVVGFVGPISEKDLKRIDLSKYRGINEHGKDGIEKYYESRLLGTIGHDKVETDARGRLIRKVESENPIPGENLQLTIDAPLQSYTYSLLKDKRGAVVALDVEHGDVLVMASSPSYDPNEFVKGITQDDFNELKQENRQPFINRAIRGQYPPGSTLKPIISIMAIERNIIDPKKKFFDPGYYQINNSGRVFRDWKHEGHGYVNISQAIAQSCTTYFYAIADEMGIDILQESLINFGLGQATGIDIFGEKSGLVPSKEWKQKKKRKEWFPGETLNVGIGQGYTLVTPLQMANLVAIIARRGKVIKPKLLKTAETQESSIAQGFSDENWDIIIDAMQKSITHHRGTAHRIYRKNSYSIAGKTGTAQVFSLKEGDSYEDMSTDESLRDHGWFIAFAPVEQPKIAIAVLLEHSNGSTVIAKKVMDRYFKENSK